MPLKYFETFLVHIFIYFSNEILNQSRGMIWYIESIKYNEALSSTFEPPVAKQRNVKYFTGHATNPKFGTSKLPNITKVLRANVQRIINKTHIKFNLFMN